MRKAQSSVPSLGSEATSPPQDAAELGRFLYRPIAFMEPERAVDPASWLGHVPFAFWIVDAMRPAVLVELGTHSGNSYASFAQAVQRLGLPTACYAVDTWQGDPQAGFYDERVFTEWSDYHDRHFAAFSSLIRSTFAEAAQHFSEGSVDLLHIDGYHTYDAAAADFATWRPKLSAGSVVLIHDINVRERDFGAWRLWEELKVEHPSFEFLHGHGLGVLGTGSDHPEPLRWLFSRQTERPADASAVREFFARLGSVIASQFAAVNTAAQLSGAAESEQVSPSPSEEIESLRSRVETADSEREAVGVELQTLRAQIDARTVELTERDAVISQLTSEVDAFRGRLAAVSADLRAETAQGAEDGLRISTLEERLAFMRQLAADVQEHFRTEAKRRARAEAERDRHASSAAAASDALSRSRRLVVELRRRIESEPTGRLRLAQRFERISKTASALGVGRVGSLGVYRCLASLLAQPARLREAHLLAGSALFDESYYRRRYADVAAGRLAPLAHFVSAGAREFRDPHPLFDSAWYAATNPDVAASGVIPLVHYLLSGAQEGRDPHPLFASWFYSTQDDEGCGGVANPLIHYLTLGRRDGRSPHPMFDPAFYGEQSPEPGTRNRDPLAHFLEHGATEARDPHPLFDVQYYLRRNPDVAATGINPVLHYVVVGAFEGRNPHPLFDAAYYLETNPDVRAAGREPLTHFLTSGVNENRNPNAFFDCQFYLDTYPDVHASGVNPLVHFARVGWREGRRPSRAFDPSHYLSLYPDVAASGVNPLGHYLESGRLEGREAVAEPDTAETKGSDRVSEPVQIRLQTRSLEAVRPEPPTVVCLSHVMPWPPRAGNEYRIYRMLSRLRDRGFRIVPIVSPLPGDRVDSEAVRGLAEQFSNAVLCKRDGQLEYILRDVPDVLASLEGGFTRAVGTLLDEDDVRDERERQCLEIDRTFCHDALVTTVLRLDQMLGPYVLLAEYVWMSRVLPLVSGRALKVIDTHDVFSTKREKIVQFGVDAWHLEPHEEAVRLRRADLVLAIQDEERQELQRLVAEVPVVTAGVDYEVIEDTSAPSGHKVLYVASDNPMNRKALRDLVRYAWPTIRREVPDAELIVAGKVGQTLTYVAEGVGVLGVVEDLRPVYGEARLVVNPAVAGTGLKIKTLEALCYLRPVVTWPSGVDGLAPELASLCVTVQDWYEFSQRVLGFLTQPEPPRFSNEQRATIVRFTSADAAYGAMEEALERWVTSGGVRS